MNHPAQAAPLVTAIVSTYKSERFLAGCLDSLQAQTIADQLEIIVVDSASPENEGAVVASYSQRYGNLVYLRTDARETIYQAWNRGVRLARGTYVTNANADDRLRPDALEILVKALEADPDAALAYGDVLVTQIPNRPFDWNLRDGWITRPDYAPDIMLSGCHMGPQPLWRRSIHDEVGLFDESLRSAGDYEFWCRLALRRPLLHVPELLGSYYDNPEGICNANLDLSARETRAVMARYRDAFPPPQLIPVTPPKYVNIGMVTYNRLEFTRHAIEALVRNADFPYVLNVVDNASSDGTKEYLQELKARGIIRHLSLLPTNVGVAKAANLAWSQETEAAYYLKLDNDIVMHRPGWLREMVAALDDVPDLGAVAYNFEPRSYPLARRNDSRLRFKNGNLGGACILIPRRTFERLGYWCEDYGLYGEEDFDYGERIRLAGLANAYMEDEDAGTHLPAGKAAAIDPAAVARDGAEEALHADYRSAKDRSRRQATGMLGQVERNLADYASGRRPLRNESSFVRTQSGGSSLQGSQVRALPSPATLLRALIRRGTRALRQLERLSNGLPTLLIQFGPGLRLLRSGRPGVARALKVAAANAQYRRWLLQDVITAEDRYAMNRLLQSLEHRPLISVLMPVCDPPEIFLRRAIESVCRQAYPNWELCIADDASQQPHVARIVDEYAARELRLRRMQRSDRGHIVAASNSALELASGEFVVLLDHDDELSEDALLLVAWQINQTPKADLLYSDEDKMDAAGRRFSPDFKPDWNPDLMLAQNACGHLGVFRTDVVRRLGGFRPGTDGCQDWDLALRLAEITSPQNIVHLPYILYHWRTAPGSTAASPRAKDYVARAAVEVVTQALRRRGNSAEVRIARDNYLRVCYPPPSPPVLISLLIPCLGESPAPLIRELLDRPPYPAQEILVAGSGRESPVHYLPELAEASPAAQRNALAAAAHGTVLVFVHPALGLPSPSAMMELVTQALRPEIGAAGPRLVAGGCVLDGGLVLGLCGPAGAAYRGSPIADPGVAGRAALVQNRTAVSANCLVLRREVFTASNGFDAKNFPAVFHDLDLCLRLANKGLRIVWTPDASIEVRTPAAINRHTSSAAEYAEELLTMRSRWGEILGRDPAYNPNLALDKPWPTPAAVPRITKPYRLA